MDWHAMERHAMERHAIERHAIERHAIERHATDWPNHETDATTKFTTGLARVEIETKI